MKTIDQMVDTGQRKLQRRVASMKTNYDNAKGRAVTGYNETPFSATMKANFADGIRDAVYVAPDPAKWARNFRAKVGGG
jgi:hypothetical protein